jgi:hypothetical protein
LPWKRWIYGSASVRMRARSAADWGVSVIFPVLSREVGNPGGKS